MQSLLSPSENSAFQSFLSIMDYPDDALTPSEWAKLTAGSSVSSSSQNTFLVDARPEHKDALTKAAKDLMSLEPDRWHSQSLAMHQAADAHGRSLVASQDRSYELQQQELQHQFHQQRQHQVLNACFSFPQGKVQEYLVRHPNLAIDGTQLSPTIQQHAPITTSPNQQRSIQPSHQRMDSSSSDSVKLSLETSHSPSSPSLRSTLQPSLTPNASTSSQALSSHRTTRQSSNSSSSKRSRASTSSSSTTPTATPVPKQNLLSPSQKKANHIQSEQKRRANIRRGYEALCETVPALREAIRQEEDDATVMAETNGASGRRKRKRGSTHGKDGTDGDKEKIDGRAGPRSENIVLMKSMFQTFSRLFPFLQWLVIQSLNTPAKNIDLTAYFQPSNIYKTCFQNALHFSHVCMKLAHFCLLVILF